MDTFWEELSDDEIEQIRALSADLYGVNTKAKSRLAALEVSKLLMQGNPQFTVASYWRQLLKSLKRCEALFPSSQVYYYKSKVWENLGDSESALWLLRKGVEADPDNANIHYIFLTQLLKFCPDEAIQRANAIASERRRPALLLFKAAEILLAQAELQEAVTPPVYQKIIILLEEALRGGSNQNDLPKSISSGGHVLAGLCWKRLGEIERAELEYTQALKADPESLVALVARGILNYGRKTPSALDDFQSAIEKKAPLVWPYFFRAHWAITTSRFDECIKMCQGGLNLSKDPDIVANLFQWLAIARFKIGGTKTDLRNTLTHAVLLSPTNQRINLSLNTVDEISQDRPIDRASILENEDMEKIGQAHLDFELVEPQLS